MADGSGIADLVKDLLSETRERTRGRLFSSALISFLVLNHGYIINLIFHRGPLEPTFVKNTIHAMFQHGEIFSIFWVYLIALTAFWIFARPGLEHIVDSFVHKFKHKTGMLEQQTTMQAENRRLKDTILEKGDLVERHKKEISELKEQISVYQKKITQHLQSEESLQGQINQKDSEIANLVGETARLREELATASAEVSLHKDALLRRSGQTITRVVNLPSPN